ncbi:MAG: hypothetical protein IJ933_02110, partial [Bacteroidales bacterium]|nr:hypothetical protein [Bacteroidales bacterium]
MNIIKAYGRGFKNSLRRPKMILLIFGITLLLGLSLALPFFFSFNTAVGSSIVSKSMDYTLYKELVNSHSWNLESLLSQGKYMVLIFWLVMIFFVGGIVRTFNKEDYSVSTFFAGAGVNFFRFLLCDVIMIALMVVTAAVLFIIASFVLSLFNTIVTETPLFWAYGIAAFIFGCAIVLFLMISDYAKFYMEMERTSRVLKAIWNATKFVFRNFLKTYFLYALLLVVPILTLILYKLTFDKIGMGTVFGIVAMFLIQQLFIILRVWFRVWSLSSQFELFADDYVKEISFDLETSHITTTTTTTTTVTSDDDDYTTISKIAVVENDENAKVDRVVVEVNTEDTLTENTDDTEKVEVEVSTDDTEKVEVEVSTDDNDNDPEATVVQFESNDNADDNEEKVTTTTTQTTVTETVVINDAGDTFTKVVEDYTDNDAAEAVDEPENDEVDQETLEQFYATDQDTDGTENTEVTLTEDTDGTENKEESLTEDTDGTEKVEETLTENTDDTENKGEE